MSPPAEAPSGKPHDGLAETPFSLTPDAEFLYHSTSHDRAVEELIGSLERGDQLMVLAGETGVGKTQLCFSLLELLGPPTVTSYVASPPPSLQKLLRMILIDLDARASCGSDDRVERAEPQQLIAAIRESAAPLAIQEASAVIIVDEAHGLPADALQGLSEVAGSGVPIQLILVGEPSLLTRLRSKELREVAGRVAVRSRLEPLPLHETAGYVAHRIAVAGRGEAVEFAQEAFAELHAATGGFPRLVNLVCDRALRLGDESSSRVIDDALIAAAAADLGLGPRMSVWRGIARAALLALLFLTFVLVGAAAAAWVFLDAFLRLVDSL